MSTSSTASSTARRPGCVHLIQLGTSTDVFADRGATFTSALVNSQEHPQSSRTQPNGTRPIPRLRCASLSLARSTTACTGPTVPRLRDVYEQVFQPPGREYGEGHPADHEALVWSVHSQPSRHVPWGLLYLHLLEYSQDHAELGAILNGFSLSEQGQLAVAIEKTGQAVDTTYMSTTKLVRSSTLSLLSIFDPPTLYSCKNGNKAGQNPYTNTRSLRTSSRSF